MEKKMKHPQKIKIISLGNREVGKSSLIRRYCECKFIMNYAPTIGIDYGIAKTVAENQDLRVNIFDLSGNPIFYEVRKEFYDNINGLFLVYDVSNRSSFEALSIWLSEISCLLAEPLYVESIIFIICGNKCDKKREVDECEGRLWAQLNGFLYFETSALTGEGVHVMFETLLESIVKLLDGRKHSVSVSNRTVFNKEQLEAICHLRWGKNNYDKLGLHAGASREEINKAYRKLAILLHPDKSNVPGSEEAFKILVSTRLDILKNFPSLK